MSLILRVGWVWTLEKYVIKFYVTNWEGRLGLNPNIYDVTLFSDFFFEGFPKFICNTRYIDKILLKSFVKNMPTIIFICN